MNIIKVAKVVWFLACLLFVALMWLVCAIVIWPWVTFRSNDDWFAWYPVIHQDEEDRFVSIYWLVRLKRTLHYGPNAPYWEYERAGK